VGVARLLAAEFPLALPLLLAAVLDLAIQLPAERLLAPRCLALGLASPGRAVLVVEDPSGRSRGWVRIDRSRFLSVLVVELTGATHRAMLVERGARVQYQRRGWAGASQRLLGAL